MARNKLNRIALGFSITMVLLAIVILLNLLKRWTYVPLKSYVEVTFGLTIALTYILYPAKQKKDVPRIKLPWYDILLMLCGIVPIGYLVFFPSVWQHNNYMGMASTLETVLCAMLLVSILEATRRVVGWVMAALGLAILVPVVLLTPLGLPRLSASLFYGGSGLIGSPVTISFTYILTFLIFGAFLSSSPAAKYILGGLVSVFGRMSGGMAKGAVAANAVVGTITGNGPAAISITGALTIPLMKKEGYSSESAAAITSVAANGGAIMPPVMGIAAFLIASMLGITYWQVCMVAWIPALLYYLGVYMQVHFEAKKLGLSPLPKETRNEPESMARGWLHLIPIVLLVYLLAFAHVPTQIAGLYSAFAVIIVSLFDWQTKKKTRKSLKDIVAWFLDSIDDAGRQMVLIGISCSAAGIIIAAVSASGIGFKMSMFIQQISGGNLFLLLFFSFAVSFVMGMGVLPIVAFLILSALVAPALVDFGVPLIASYMFLFIAGLSAFITPPVALNVYVASGIAESNMMKTGWAAVRFGIMTFVLPFIIVYNTGLLMIGPPAVIIWATFRAIIATVLIAAGCERYFLKKLSWVEVGLFMLGGVFLVFSDMTFNIAGLMISFVVFIWHLVSTMRLRRLRTEKANAM